MRKEEHSELKEGFYPVYKRECIMIEGSFGCSIKNPV